MFSVHRCACEQNKPSEKLKRWVLRIVKYLKHTRNIGLVFQRKNFNSAHVLVGYCDASFLSETKSLSRYGVLFFVAGALVHWSSTKTSRIVSPSTEAEVHGLVHLGKEISGQREFHQGLGYFREIPPTLVYQDNTAAISLSHGAPVHKRSKHFGMEFDMFREYVLLKKMLIQHMDTGDLVADMLTKPLPPRQFTVFRDELMGGPSAQAHFR